MIKLLVFAVIFIAAAACIARLQGWMPTIRRHPWQAVLLAIIAFGATIAGGTKGGTNDPPPVIVPPSSTNIVLRLYWHELDGRLYPIDALLKDIKP